MIHRIIRNENPTRERHEYWISPMDKNPYYVCYRYFSPKELFDKWIEDYYVEAMKKETSHEK